jgi:CDP-6-deoxy-D-xylo-4-hexulose-3-dehydrase
MKIPLALEGLTSDEIELVCEVFRSGDLTMGKRVKKFEEEFAQKFGSRFAVMVNSGSSANLLALEVLRDRNRFEDRTNQYVAVPAVLWPTSLWPIIQLGFKVLLIDTIPGTLEMDLEELKRARSLYGEKLIGAVVIHPLGKSLDLNEIATIKSSGNFFILEDNCESIGSGNSNKFAGTIGDFGSYSFYYSHHMTTVEGGMITTNDENYANDLLSMRAHGWTRNRRDKNSIEELNPSLPRDFLFVTPGYNFRPMEFQGALGSSQLKRLDEFISKRTVNALKIKQALEGKSLRLIGSETLENATTGQVKSGPVSNSWMALPIATQDPGVDISMVRTKLEETGISTRPLLAGDFTSQPAGNYPGIEAFGDLLNSKKIYASAFMIGNHHNYTDLQVDYLASKLKEFHF